MVKYDLYCQNCNDNLYVGTQGFYDVVFHSFKHGCVFLVHVPISFDRGLLYAIQWSPTVSRRFARACATRATTGMLDWGGRLWNYRKEEDDNVREEDKQEEE